MRKLYLWLSYAIGNSAVMTFVLLLSLNMFGDVMGLVVAGFFAVLMLVGNTVALNDTLRIIPRRVIQQQDEEEC